jgi:hypothetical protein
MARARTGQRPGRAQRRPARRRGARDPSGKFGTTVGRISATRITPGMGQIVHACRTTRVGIIATATDAGQYVDFSLNDVGNSNEFTSLFRLWRIDKVVCELQWVPSSESTVKRPTVYYGVDPPATSAPANIDGALEKPHRRWTPTVSDLVTRFTPDVRVIDVVGVNAVGPGAALGNALAPRKQWISTIQPQTSYGLLWMWINNYNTTGTVPSGNLVLTTTYHFAFTGLT